MTTTGTAAGTAPAPAAGAEPASLLRSSAVLGVALMVANAAGYLLAVVGSHRLDAASYGVLASLLAVLLVASVPALALQAVVARRTAVDALPLWPALLAGAVVGALCLVAGLVLLAPLTAFLHLPDHGVALVWTALGLLPLNVLFAVQGHLQGHERFSRLSVVVVGFGAGRAVGGILPLALGGGPASVMAGIAVGNAVAAAVGLRVVGGSGRAPDAAGLSVRAVRPELGAAILSMGAVLVLSNLDLLLARHQLSGTASGRYAAGNVVAKAAFWLPQAIPLAALPKLTSAVSRGRALRDAALATAALGAASVAVTAAAGPFLTRLTFGAGYSSVGHIAWLFALQGSALAAVQLLVVDDIARRRHAVAPMVLVAAVVETVVVLATGVTTGRALIAVAAVTAALLTAAAAARHLLVGAGGQWPASSQVVPTPTDTSSETSRA